MIERLSPRERRLVGIASALVILVVGWTYVWSPLQDMRSRANSEIVEARMVQQALALYPADAAAPTPPPITADGPPAARVTRAAEVEGIALARIEPRGTGLTVVVDEAPFESVVAWIARMEREEALRLSAISLDRRPTPGTVSARLDLETP